MHSSRNVLQRCREPRLLKQFGDLCRGKNALDGFRRGIQPLVERTEQQAVRLQPERTRPYTADRIDGVNHVQKCDSISRPCEYESTVLAALRHHQAGTAEGLQYL